MAARVRRRASAGGVVAQAPRHDGEAAPQTTLERAAMSGLLQWAKRGEPLHGAESRRLPHYFDGLQISRPLPELVLAPLANSHGPIGLLVLAAPSGRAFGIKHVEVIQALQEPFAAALENNLRLRWPPRATAEADRRSLLTASVGRTWAADRRRESRSSR